MTDLIFKVGAILFACGGGWWALRNVIKQVGVVAKKLDEHIEDDANKRAEDKKEVSDLDKGVSEKLATISADISWIRKSMEERR